MYDDPRTQEEIDYNDNEIYRDPHHQALKANWGILHVAECLPIELRCQLPEKLSEWDGSIITALVELSKISKQHLERTKHDLLVDKVKSELLQVFKERRARDGRGLTPEKFCKVDIDKVIANWKSRVQAAEGEERSFRANQINAAIIEESHEEAEVFQTPLVDPEPSLPQNPTPIASGTANISITQLRALTETLEDFSRGITAFQRPVRRLQEQIQNVVAAEGQTSKEVQQQVHKQRPNLDWNHLFEQPQQTPLQDAAQAAQRQQTAHSWTPPPREYSDESAYEYDGEKVAEGTHHASRTRQTTERVTSQEPLQQPNQNVDIQVAQGREQEEPLDPRPAVQESDETPENVAFGMAAARALAQAALDVIDAQPETLIPTSEEPDPKAQEPGQDVVMTEPQAQTESVQFTRPAPGAENSVIADVVMAEAQEAAQPAQSISVAPSAASGATVSDGEVAAVATQVVGKVRKTGKRGKAKRNEVPVGELRRSVRLQKGTPSYKE